MHEQSDRHQIIREILYLRYPSDDPEDRIGRRDLAREIGEKPFDDLRKMKDELRQERRLPNCS